MPHPSHRDEQRRSRRTPTRLAASIRADDEGPGFPCVVLDISDGGAKLDAGRPLSVPERFTLVFSTMVQRHCEVRWRGEQFVGVKFIEG